MKHLKRPVISFVFASFLVFGLKPLSAGDNLENARGYVSGKIADLIGQAYQPTDSEVLNVLAAEASTAQTQDLLATALEDELSDALERLGTGYHKLLLRHWAENGVNLDELRKEIFAKTKGKPLVIKIKIHPRANATKGKLLGMFKRNPIDVANDQLTKVGFDFIRYEADETETADDPLHALSKDADSYQRWTKTRTIVIPAVVLGATVISGMITNGQLLTEEGFQSFMKASSALLGGGLTGAFLEVIFARFSKFFDRHLWKYSWGPASVNIIFYPLFLYLGGAAAASLAGMEAPSNPILRIVLTGLAATFSFGAFQNGLNLLKARGELSEFPRLRQENLGCYYMNSFRPITAVGGRLAMWVSSGVQAVFAMAVSLPLWGRIAIGDPLHIKDTRRLFEANSSGCSGRLGRLAKGRDALTEFFTFSKRAP